MAPEHQGAAGSERCVSRQCADALACPLGKAILFVFLQNFSDLGASNCLLRACYSAKEGCGHEKQQTVEAGFDQERPNTLSKRNDELVRPRPGNAPKCVFSVGGPRR